MPGGQRECSGGQAQGEERGMDLCRGDQLEQGVGDAYRVTDCANPCYSGVPWLDTPPSSQM